MNKYAYINNDEDLDTFENILNKYIVTDIIKQDIGTILRKEDINTFKEYFKVWVKEASNTRLINRTACSLRAKRYKWNESLTEDEKIEESLKALHLTGIV